MKCSRFLKSVHIALQCPNKRIMVIKEHKDIESKSDKSEEDKMSQLKDRSDVEYLVDEKTLVISNSLNIQINKDDIEQHMENIFHIIFHINNKVS